MSEKVVAWPKLGGELAPSPRRMSVAADYGLASAVRQLEVQLGSVEAYNRLVERAARLRAKIERGDGEPQNPHYAVNPELRPPVFD